MHYLVLNKLHTDTLARDCHSFSETKWREKCFIVIERAEHLHCLLALQNNSCEMHKDDAMKSYCY